MFGLIAVVVVMLVVLVFLVQTVKVVPQSRVGIVQRFGRYHRTAQSGLTFVVPIMDQMLPKTDLREQVVSFQPQAVITNDNVGMQISTVVYYRVVDARAAEYEVANVQIALEQITQTNLRNVIGNLSLDKTLVSRERDHERHGSPQSEEKQKERDREKLPDESQGGHNGPKDNLEVQSSYKLRLSNGILHQPRCSRALRGTA